MKVFVYGSLLIPEITLPKFEVVFSPRVSCFATGAKMTTVTKSNGYTFLLLQETDDSDDIVSGFIIDIPDLMLPAVDSWEGEQYERRDIVVYDRWLNSIKCQTYMLKTTRCRESLKK